MNELQLKLSLTVDQANLVLNALSKLPYESVAGLIGVITSQAQEQMRADQEAKAALEAPKKESAEA